MAAGVVRRVDCARCGIHVEHVPWAALGSRFTAHFEEMAAYLEENPKTAKAILAAAGTLPEARRGKRKRSR